MKQARRILSYVVLFLLLAILAVLLWKHDEIFDRIAARNYHPSAAVAQYVVDTTMTPEAQRLFYANRPAIEDKTAFNVHCRDTETEVATLGCYLGNRQGIYVYNVTDARLNGVQQVTSAHEMLHQAYDRLSKKEKQHINSLLNTAFLNVQEQSIKDQIATYQKTEPDQISNEMHSILGTEAATLSPELEEYYARYFTSRQSIVQYYKQYQSEFDKRMRQIADYDARLEVMSTQINTKKEEIDADEKALEQRRAQLDQYLANDQITTYNAAVPGYNAQVEAYRQKVKATNQIIAEYNTLLDQRNTIAVQERELQQALDSQVDSATKQ